MNLHIEDYRPEWKSYFDRFNKAWLEEYFFVEPIDKWVLENPEEAILKDGGHILFVLDENVVIGTVALRTVGPGIYEMTKMAVDKAHQGKGAGLLLCKAAIRKAKESGADKLLLYSNTRLSTAISIYRKLGFMEADMEQGIYERADIKMEMPLRNVQPDTNALAKLVESYGQAYDKLMACLNEIPEEIWHWQPPHKKWTIHQNILHLADSEAHGYIRCRVAIVSSGSPVQAFDQDAWVSRRGYESQSAGDALLLYRMLRKTTWELIRNQPAAVWNQTFIHSENGEIPLWQWLRHFENHTHIRQIKRVYEAWLETQQRDAIA